MVTSPEFLESRYGGSRVRASECGSIHCVHNPEAHMAALRRCFLWRGIMKINEIMALQLIFSVPDVSLSHSC